jgi:Mn-dependent DtxR family transcriptional regulator
VIDLVSEHQPVNIGFVERASAIKRVTLKAILTRLQKKGLIQMEGKKKGSLYRIK